MASWIENLRVKRIERAISRENRKAAAAQLRAKAWRMVLQGVDPGASLLVSDFPPYIDVGYSGWKTEKNSKVNVGFNSPRGMIGGYSYPRTPQGEAEAESIARSLSHILGLEISDRRPAQRREGA